MSTPFGTTTAGAGISGANIRRTSSPQQISRSGGLNAAQARSASRSRNPPFGAARAPDDRNPELPRDRRRGDPRERHRREDDVGAPLDGDAVNLGGDPPHAAQVAARQREPLEAARLAPSAGKIGRVNEIVDAVFAQPVESRGAGAHHRRDVEPELRQQRHRDRSLPFGAAERRRRLQVEQPHPRAFAQPVARSSWRVPSLHDDAPPIEERPAGRGNHSRPRVCRRGREVDRCRRHSCGAVAGRRQHRVDVRRVRGRNGGRGGSLARAASALVASVVGRDADQPLRRLGRQRAVAVLRAGRGRAPALAAARANGRPGWRRWWSIACCSSPPGRRSSCSRRWSATRVPAVPRSYEIAALISAGVISIAVAAVAVGAATGRLVGKLRWALVVFGVPPTNGKGKAMRRATTP